MIPGPHRLYRCLHCQNLFARRTLISGNTFGAQFRSDGQMRAPMLPQTPPLVACPHCHHLFCMLDAEHETECQGQQCRDVPFYGQATLAQCLEYVQQDRPFQQLLRLYAWQRANDERMQAPRALTDAETANLQALLPLLDERVDVEAMLKAEALRELGLFAQAAQVLQPDIDSDLAPRAEQILQAIERQDAQPFVFACADRDGDMKFLWAWRARHYQPDSPQDTGAAPLDPPDFPISNRDWWVKVLGMCCHNWALIEPQTPEGAVAYFFHDMGSTGGPDDFLSETVQGRSAVIDSLRFDSVRAAQLALRRNGFDRLLENPGPWLGFEPTGRFYDARPRSGGVYSGGKYWKR